MPDDSTDPTALADIPSIRVFQLDNDTGPGGLGNSVNLFRGSVSLPLPLVSLRGRNGLDVNVTIAYGSDVEPLATTWNGSEPTSVLGLGWTIPAEMVTRSAPEPAAPDECTFYLVHSGIADQLVRTGQDEAGRWTYILRNYEFWEITQDTATETWRVVKEDGTAQVYGGLTSDGTTRGIEWGVAWANWAGSASGSPGAQHRYPLAWRLTSAVSPAGDTVQYSYHQVEEAVGPGGLAYTKACYPRRITDTLGRVIEFRYAEKLHGAAGPDGSTVYEYRDPHKDPRLDYPNNDPNAYQDRYQTRYLDSISVSAKSGALLTLLRFGYDLRTFTDTSQAGAYLWKRCLTSVRQYNSRGESLPGITMDYYGEQDTMPGALASLTHTYGGTARFHYAEQPLATSRQLTVTGPGGATPRVWHGADYVVVAWYGTGGGDAPLLVSAYSWIGWWVEQELISQSVQLDLATLNVVAADDYLAVQHRAGGTGDSLTLFRRDVTQAGTWAQTWTGAFALSTTDQAPQTGLASGDELVVLANADYTAGPVQAIAWDYRSRSWTPVPAPDLLGGPGQVIAVAARSGYYVACGYDTGAGSATFAIVSRDPSGAWSQTATWSDSFPLDISAPGLTLALGPTCVVVTAVTGLDERTLASQTRTYLWDDAMHPLDPGQPLIRTHTTPVSNGTPQSPVQIAVTAGSLVANGTDLTRYVGGITGPGFDPVPYWPATSFTPGQDATCQYAFGDDVAVLTADGTSTLLTFDPDAPAASAWSAPVTLSPGGPDPTISGDYLTVGSALYIRRPGQGWVTVAVDLPGDIDTASIQNQAPGYLVYQDTGGASAQSYAVLLGNDGATVLGALPGGPQKVLPDSQVVNGTRLAGPSAFVTYPAATSFDTAPSLTLYRVAGGDVTGSLVDHPVDRITVDNGYGELMTQGFLYDASTTTYDAVSGVAQYTKVTSVPGVSDPVTDTRRPFGHTDHYFSNATLQQTDPFYPSGTQYNYDGLLNGIKLCEQDFDDSGTLTSSTVNYWEPYQTDPSDGQSMLPAAYFRRSKTVMTQDGMEPNVTEYAYDHATGLVLTATTTVHDSTGAARTVVSSTMYGYQVPQYAPALLAAHQLSTPVQRTTTVDGTATTSKVTTLRSWGSGYWAALDSYQWQGTGDGPVFDFGGAPSPDWLRLKHVVSRDAVGYQITEATDARGTPNSFLYDSDSLNPVAKFFNASLAGNELAWADFEPYSAPEGWIIGPGATVNDTDAHTGVASLRLAPAGQPGLTAALTPARQDFDYLLLAWIKTAPDFAADPGEAAWMITLNQATAVSVPVTDTGGTWVPVTIPIPVASADQQVMIGVGLRNGKTRAWVAVDDIRLSPLSCGSGVQIYDDATGIVTATIGAAGNVMRFGLDSFLRQNLVAGPVGNVTSLSASYYSSDGNAGVFTGTDPNLALQVSPSVGGSFDTFRNGDEWRARWRPDSGAWQVISGQLAYTGTGMGTLTAADGNGTDYVVRVRLRPTAPLTAPLALHVGSRLVISWDPTDGSWQLTDSADGQQSTPGTLFTAPLAPYRQPLDNGTVPGGLREVFAGYGCALTDPLVTVPVSGQRWIITDNATGTSYHLHADGDLVAVARPPYEWLAIVGSERVLVYADGRHRFSYLPRQPLSGAASLVVADPVAVDDLVLAAGPRMTATFRDGVGADRQAHQLFGTRSVAQQIACDPLGRATVRTKNIFVTPADSSPLLSYQPDLVTSLDWTTGIMTGRVADDYPADEGYPYQRVSFEPTPHGRAAELGQPGKLLAIDLTNPDRHTTRYVYTTNDGTADGLPARQYHERVATDPDGAVTSDLVDRLGRMIRSRTDVGGPERVQQVFAEHDIYGNAVAVRPPNYYDPPPDTRPADWVTTVSYDFSGRMTVRTVPGLGVTQCVYSPAGDLRFVRESAGGQQGVYLYNRYDSLGRLTEAGQIAGDWDPVKLQDIADTDPTWPPSPPTWRKRMSYDGDGTSPYPIGRPTRVQVNLGDSGVAQTVELATYDAWGAIARMDTTASGYDSATRGVVTTHDNQGALTSLSVPSEPAFGPIVYQHDEMSRVVAIGTAADPSRYATYTYGADSTIATETLAAGSASPISRTFSYSPPEWPTRISHVFGKSSLTVGIDYTQGGLDNTSYYTGQVARLGIQRSWPGAPADISTGLRYDTSTGAMVAAQTDGQPAWDVDSARYDANGNVTSVQVGDASWAYHYAADDRLLSVDGLGASFGYDDSGYVISASYPDRAVTYTIDPTLHRARSALARAAGTSTTVEFDYNGRDRRLVKRVTGDGGSTSTLYLYGPSGYPVLEKTRAADGTETPVLNIEGVSGLIATETAKAGPLFLLTDHQRSTRAVVDGSGEVIAWYDYLPHGGLARSAAGSPVPVRYLYTGQEYDAELGVYNYGARFYDPAIGRFYAPDEEGQFAGPYTYAANDPMSNIDPSGNMGFLAILGIIAQIALDVIIEVVSEGAATPLVAAEADTQVALFATEEVAEGAADALTSTAGRVAATSATKTGEEEGAAATEEAAVSTGVKTTPPRPRTVLNKDDPIPPDAEHIGVHATSSLYEASLRNGIKAIWNSKNFATLRYGSGFYVTNDEVALRFFAQEAVRKIGGEERYFNVYLRNFAKLKGTDVPEELDYTFHFQKPETERLLKDFDYLRGGRNKVTMSPPQTKVNPRAYQYLILKRRFSTLARRTEPFRMPPPRVSGRNAIVLVRFFIR